MLVTEQRWNPLICAGFVSIQWKLMRTNGYQHSSKYRKRKKESRTGLKKSYKEIQDVCLWLDPKRLVGSPPSQLLIYLITICRCVIYLLRRLSDGGVRLSFSDVSVSFCEVQMSDCTKVLPEICFLL